LRTPILVFPIWQPYILNFGLKYLFVEECGKRRKEEDEEMGLLFAAVATILLVGFVVQFIAINYLLKERYATRAKITITEKDLADEKKTVSQRDEQLRRLVREKRDLEQEITFLRRDIVDATTRLDAKGGRKYHRKEDEDDNEVSQAVL